MSETGAQSLHIVGNGNLGSDLREVALAYDFTIEPDAAEADFIALCTPSHIAEPILAEGTYDGKTIVDLSGAAKQKGIGQYGLMLTDTKPWDPDFGTQADVYANPGCIAGAVIKGLGAAGLTGKSLPKHLSVFSVGGQSHGSAVEQDEIRLARRLNTHPHVTEIERAFNGQLEVVGFMPVTADVPHGLFVGMSGKAPVSPKIDAGSEQLAVGDVLGTDELRHRLEYAETGLDFSLGVVIDNLRFVTQNAVQLMRFIAQSRTAE